MAIPSPKPAMRSRTRALWQKYLSLTTLLVVLAVKVEGKGKLYNWLNASATFYGGADGAGTMGGACGYGNLYASGYGLMTAAASTTIWAGGRECGTCYEVKCASPSHCTGSNSIVVTVTNFCPRGGTGCCNPGRHHLDMSQFAYTKIAAYKSGIVPTIMRRVNCIKHSGVEFSIKGNPWFLSVLVTNVAGPGNLRSMRISTDRGKTWKGMGQDWGMTWISGGGGKVGKSLSFELVTLTPRRKLVILDAVPASWSFGGTYSSPSNFIVRTKKSPKKAAARRQNLERPVAAGSEGSSYPKWIPRNLVRKHLAFAKLRSEPAAGIPSVEPVPELSQEVVPFHMESFKETVDEVLDNVREAVSGFAPAAPQASTASQNVKSAPSTSPSTSPSLTAATGPSQTFLPSRALRLPRRAAGKNDHVLSVQQVEPTIESSPLREVSSSSGSFDPHRVESRAERIHEMLCRAANAVVDMATSFWQSLHFQRL
eukprot:TRINITY_DN30041_c0_g1_i1.p1 TRINITY_DN30041_c0_g1~~TRINITY_DN30041_c0_g1_i1.p1  ORF type:complete len:482 (-),score=44.30 TRINITY_DN30041_c0_g1_i1:1060-2505(-)